MKYTTPLPEALIDELLPFWTTIFGEAAWDVERAVFLGAEEDTSRSTLYLQRVDAQLAGTCFMMQSTTLPGLAGFGEVATAPNSAVKALPAISAGRPSPIFARLAVKPFSSAR